MRGLEVPGPKVKCIVLSVQDFNAFAEFLEEDEKHRPERCHSISNSTKAARLSTDFRKSTGLGQR